MEPLSSKKKKNNGSTSVDVDDDKTVFAAREYCSHIQP
jgi:hypothetical protein